MQLPIGTESTDPIQRTRRQKVFWDRLKTVCPRGTFYHGPLLQHNGQECRTALEYDEAMLATRDFWFKHPVRYDRDWHDTLSAYRRCVSPWPQIPEPTEQDYIEHLLLTKDSAPGPDGLPYALWCVFPQQTAAILKDDFHHILAGTLAPPTQVGVWIPKAKQGPTADFFRPLGMPDTLDRLQDGTAAAIVFRVTRHSFHPAQTLLNSFREPQRAVLEVSVSMRIGYFTYYAFASAPLGSSSLHVTCFSADEFDVKSRDGSCQREMCIQVLIWEDLRRCTSSAWPWTRSLLCSIESHKLLLLRDMLMTPR